MQIVYCSIIIYLSLIAPLDCERSLLSAGLLASQACQGKGGTADNTSRNEIRPLFALVKLVPPLHKRYFIYPIKSIQ